MKPLGDRVIVRRTATEEKTPGGLYLADNAKEKPLEGEVTHVGAGRYFDGKRVPLDVKVKDKVLFGKYSGVETKIKDEDVLILREEEILVVL